MYIKKKKLLQHSESTFTPQQILDCAEIYRKYKYPNSPSIYTPDAKYNHNTSFIRRGIFWLFLYYNALDSYQTILKKYNYTGITSSGVSEDLKNFKAGMEVKDKQVMEYINTMKLLLEGTKTLREQIYIDFIKSNRTIYEYLTKEYK